jgi:hypothetical protein
MEKENQDEAIFMSQNRVFPHKNNEVLALI